MAEPFLGEIRMMSFVFPPKGWALCNGQLLPINQNQALFALIGTYNGGDGRVNFALPDLRGRIPMHRESTAEIGERAGEEAHLLTSAELPQHNHSFNVVSVAPGPVASPLGQLMAPARGQYAEAGDVAMHPGALTIAGSSQPHQNMPPFVTISFCIALQGIFPSQT
jgi:microcystin-dependent protein